MQEFVERNDGNSLVVELVNAYDASLATTDIVHTSVALRAQLELEVKEDLVVIKEALLKNGSIFNNKVYINNGCRKNSG